MEPFFYYDKSLEYPENAPFNPNKHYPEYPFRNGNEERSQVNRVYEAIRESFIAMRLDENHVGTPEWNPLREYIREGQTVLIKPNMVNHRNPAEEDFRRGMDCLVTHPSLVRCLFDYVFIALHGKGRIIIGDAPIQGCDFGELTRNTGYGDLFQFAREKSTSLLSVFTADLREVTRITKAGKVIQMERESVEFPGICVDLGKHSFFNNVVEKRRLRVTSYDGRETTSRHTEEKNEYKISSAALEADVIISMPKPKTHRIAGYTGALKNMIGTNTRKEYIPHHRLGTKEEGGDEYTSTHKFWKRINSIANDLRNHAVKAGNYRLERIWNSIGSWSGRRLNKLEPSRIRNGFWHGNDTIWRSILDINHCLYFADREGTVRNVPQRQFLYIGDMVVCGDHEGPLEPSYKKVGGILFADDPIKFDMTVVRIMGFDWRKFPVLVHALTDDLLVKNMEEIPDKFSLKCSKPCFEGKLCMISFDGGFVPPLGWRDTHSS